MRRCGASLQVRATLALAALLMLAGWCTPAGAMTFTLFPTGPDRFGYPLGITAGPDSNLWFTDTLNHAIGRITTTGTITEFSNTPPLRQPAGIAAGPDGNLWFADLGLNAIGRITPTGTITEFSNTPPLHGPKWIAAGSDGNLWFTDTENNAIGRITPAGTITEFPDNTPWGGNAPVITAGPDGNLWFTEPGPGIIGRITPTGTITEFSNTPPLHGPQGIAAGPDGNVWFADEFNHQIGRITPAGTITEFPVPGNDTPFAITAGPEGNLWFIDAGTNAIGRITPTGTITMFPNATISAFQEGDITTGPDGNLWFTDPADGKIGRISDLQAPPPANPGNPPGDGTAAVTVSRETLSPTTFAAAPSGPSAVAAKRRYGTRVTFVLNRAATVRFTVTQARPGRKTHSGHCAAPTRANRTAHACTRTVTLTGHFTRTGKTAKNTFRFTGRLNGHRLKPGTYKLVATPTTTGAHAKSAAFRIAR